MGRGGGASAPPCSRCARRRGTEPPRTRLRPRGAPSEGRGPLGPCNFLKGGGGPRRLRPRMLDGDGDMAMVMVVPLPDGGRFVRELWFDGLDLLLKLRLLMNGCCDGPIVFTRGGISGCLMRVCSTFIGSSRLAAVCSYGWK